MSRAGLARGRLYAENLLSRVTTTHTATPSTAAPPAPPTPAQGPAGPAGPTMRSSQATDPEKIPNLVEETKSAVENTEEAIESDLTL